MREAVQKSVAKASKDKEDEKEKNRKAREQKVAKHDKPYTKAMKKIFKEQLDDVIAAVEKENKPEKSISYKKINIIEAFKDYSKRYLDLFTNIQLNIFKESGEDALEFIRSKNDLITDSDEVREMLKNNILFMSKTVDKVTIEKVREVIDEAVDE